MPKTKICRGCHRNVHKFVTAKNTLLENVIDVLLTFISVVFSVLSIYFIPYTFGLLPART